MFKVKLYDKEGDFSEEMTLPFPPFVGLFLMAEWKNNGDYVQVEQIYWDAEKKLFEVYAKEGFN